MSRSRRFARIVVLALLSACGEISVVSRSEDAGVASSTPPDASISPDEFDALQQDAAGVDATDIDAASDAPSDSLSDPIDAMPDVPVDAPTDAPSNDVTVVVTNIGAPKPNVQVVFHDADGTILGTATTNAQGRATWSGAPPAMVTALLGNDEYRQLLTWVDVKPGDVLNVVDLITDWPLGKYTIITDGTLTDAGATQYFFNVNGCDDRHNPWQFPFQIALDPGCTRGQNAFTLSAYAVGTAIGHAYAKKIPPLTDAGATSVQMSKWLPSMDGHVSIVNATLPAGQMAQPLLFEIADGIGFLRGGVSDVELGPTTFALIPGFADALQGGFLITTNNAIRTVEKRVPSGDITVDFATALPEILDVQLDVTEVIRPTIQWNSATSLAVTDGGMIRLTFSGEWGQQWRAWNFILPPHATSVKAPALPVSADPWLPLHSEPNSAAFDPPRVFFLESNTLPSYDEVRRRGAVLVPPSSRIAPEARVVLPTDGDLRFTSYQGYAPYAH